MNSKRDYEAMVKILGDLRCDVKDLPPGAPRYYNRVVNETLEAVAYAYADVAEVRNKNFDRNRFLLAAGVQHND